MTDAAGKVTPDGDNIPPVIQVGPLVDVGLGGKFKENITMRAAREPHERRGTNLWLGRAAESHHELLGTRIALPRNQRNRT